MPHLVVVPPQKRCAKDSAVARLVSVIWFSVRPGYSFCLCTSSVPTSVHLPRFIFGSHWFCCHQFFFPALGLRLSVEDFSPPPGLRVSFFVPMSQLVRRRVLISGLRVPARGSAS
jgi:hypothetical protein